MGFSLQCSLASVTRPRYPKTSSRQSTIRKQRMQVMNFSKISLMKKPSLSYKYLRPKRVLLVAYKFAQAACREKLNISGHAQMSHLLSRKRGHKTRVQKICFSYILCAAKVLIKDFKC